MSQLPTSSNLTNVQLELLKMFAYNLPEDELQDLKQTLVKFFAKRIRNHADMIWKERGYTAETMKNWLNEDSQ